MRIDFDTKGVSLNGECHLPYSHSNYDDFIYILQKHGLRNLVENVSHFTITNQALITDIKNEFMKEIETMKTLCDCGSNQDTKELYVRGEKVVLCESCRVRVAMELKEESISIQPNGKYKTAGNNEYVEGTYRLWLDGNGSLRFKLDGEKELYYVPKHSKLYNSLVNDLFDTTADKE